MEATNSPQKPKRSVGKKILRIVFGTLLIIILLLTAAVLLLFTPPVQDFARKKAQNFLSNKLKTRVDIGRIAIRFPKKIVLENIYVEDLQKDTLFAGGEIKVDISMLKLLQSEVEVNHLELSELTAKIKRSLPDTTYNFQFIIDAFSSKNEKKPATTDTSSMKISVNDIDLDKIRLVYNDVVTGNDMVVWIGHFDTEIETFDLDKMRFDVPVTRINGINAKIYQHKPLLEQTDPVKDSAEASSSSPLSFNFDKLQLSDINLDYGNDVSAFYTKLNLGKLNINSEKIDLQNQVISLKKIEMDNTFAGVRLGKKEAAKKAAENIKEEADTLTQNGWKIYVANIELNDNNIDFNNDNSPALKTGMDYAHLGVKGLTLHADNFLFTPDSIAGVIKRGQVTEQSGFQLNTLQTDFLYAGNEAYLKDLLLETPGTTLKRSVVIRYPSLDALKKDIGLMQLDINLNQSRVQVKDILTFVPSLSAQPAFANPSLTWLLNGDVNGSVSRLNIENLQVSGLSDTRVDIKGNITGLPDMDKLNGNLAIRSFRTSRRDIQAIVPKGTLPSTITLPELLNLRGTVAGSMDDARANLELNTNLGSATVNGSVLHAKDKKRARYNARVSAKQLNLGVIMQNDSMFGPLTASFVASGTGFDLKTANANIKGVINSAVLKRYNYKDVRLEGQLARQKATFSLNIDDPNIDLTVDGNADLSTKFPSVVVNAVVDSIKTLPLHFTPDVLVYRGEINADFPVTDPKNLEGQLLVTKSILAIKDQRYLLDTIMINAGREDTGQFIRMKSEAASFALTGKYDLTQLGSVFQQAIQPYYAIIPDYKADTVSDYDFRFTGHVINSPLLKVFMPTLERLDPILMNGHFVSGSGWQTNIDAPLIIMGTNRIQNLRLNAGTTQGAIQLNAGLTQLSSGTSMNIYATNINARISNNKIDFLVDLKDKNSKDKYKLGGLFQQPSTGVYALSLNPDSLLLNYDKWQIAQDNIFRLDKGDIHVTNFAISKGDQRLSLNSSSPAPNAPLQVQFGNFRIGTIMGFAKQDTLLADGTINGQVLLKDLPTQPTFTSDLSITDLTVRKDTVGNLSLQVSNTTENVFKADVTISGKGNDIALQGNYYVKPANQSLIDLALDIRKLQMTTLEAVTDGAVTKTTGFIDGKFDIKGTFDKPDVNGNLNFNQTGFSPTMLGSYYTIDKERITVNNEGIRFDNFSILDSSKNELNLDGTAITSNFINYKLDLNLTATNFQALNSTKRDNPLFYGQFYFNTDLHIGGTELKPVVDGNLSINDQTKFTVVLPQEQPGVVEREGIIRFVDMDSLAMDTTLLLGPYDSLNKAEVRGMDVAVNIEINKGAEFTLIVDETNGDFVRMKGTAQLTGGIDPSGKTNLTGTYEIEEGSYDLSFNLLKRKFLINKGSKITWLGEPTRADVDLTAVYVANTAPLTLVGDQNNTTDNTFKQKLPFEVNLVVNGELLKPEITFDIILPEKNYTISENVVRTVEEKLRQLRTQPSELNKQVFALLLLNRFVSENPFASSGDGFNAGSFARQSVSKILSEQLNNLASDLIKGVDLNLGLNSTEDYTSGKMANRTDLNVSLSKQLLNDRLKVTVGSNFELEGPQNSTSKSTNLAGNVALDYLLSKDGRYLLRAYRKNEYEGELDGYIIETGLNFIITVDYDRFSEIFHLPKEKKMKRRRDKTPSELDTRKAGPVTPPDINN